MSIKHNAKIKKLLFVIIGTYIASYTGLTCYAILDYNKNKDRIFDNAPNHLLVQEYSAEVNGKKKKLALVGEAHNYTDKESRYALEIMEKYGDIAREGSDKEIKGKKFAKICSYASIPAGYFYLTGSGRIALDSNFLSAICTKANRKKTFGLEDKNPLDSLNNTQKTMFLAKLAIDVLSAPIEYFKGRAERNISLEKYKKIIDKERKKQPFYYNSDERETKMAGKIEEIISKDDIDSLVCFIGATHLVPIENKLKNKLILSDINTVATARDPRFIKE